MKDLQELGFDTEIIGFSTQEVDLILEAFPEASGADREDQAMVPVLPRVSRPGDIWVLGKHWLLCDDGRSKGCVDLLMEDEDADLVFTDPPYNVPIAGNVSGLGQVTHRDFVMAAGEMEPDDFMQFLRNALGNAVRRSRGGALHYICMDWRHLYEILTVGKELYTSLLNLCVWNKTNGGMGSFYRSKHELVLVFKAGDARHLNNVDGKARAKSHQRLGLCRCKWLLR